MSGPNQGYLAGLGNYPQFNPLMPTQVNADTRNAMVPFNSPRNMVNPPYQGVPRSGDTLHKAFENEIAQATEFVYFKVADTTGWAFDFAARIPTNAMETQITIYTMADYVFDRTAELTTPRFLDFKEETYKFRIDHWQLGIEVYEEHLATPHGAQELQRKLLGLSNAAVLTQELMIKAAVINAPNYWLQQYHMTQHYNSVYDATDIWRKSFGAITKDKDGLNKINSMLDLIWKNSPRQPKINMCVIPRRATTQIQWHPANTEAWRRGDAVAERNKLATPLEMVQGLLPYPVYIDKELNPENTNNTLPIDAFKREARLGQFTILENTDDGPLEHGYPIPAIRKLTMPENEMTTFTARELLDNCHRFGSDGTVKDFTEKIVNMDPNDENKPSNIWDSPQFQEALIDPFVYLYQGERGTRLEICELWGEQNTRHRPEEHDVEQGLKFAQNCGLSTHEIEQLDILMQAADNLAEIPSSDGVGYDDASAVFARTYAAVVKPARNVPAIDMEWGGTYLNNTVLTDAAIAAANADLGNANGLPSRNDGERAAKALAVRNAQTALGAASFIPYGFSGIFSVMSLLRNLNKEQRENLNKIWYYGPRLEYEVCRTALHKLWKKVERAFPELSVKNADSVPSFARTGKKHTDEMISVFRGLFERVRHPVWATGDVVNDGNRVVAEAPITRADFDPWLQSGAANLAGRELVAYLKGATDTSPRTTIKTGYTTLVKAGTRLEGRAAFHEALDALRLESEEKARRAGGVLNTAAAVANVAAMTANRIWAHHIVAAATQAVWLIRQSLKSTTTKPVTITQAALDGIYAAGLQFARTRGEEALQLDNTHRTRRSGNDELVNTRLSVWRDAFTNGSISGGNDFVATNARVGDVPLQGGRNNDNAYAQARLRGQDADEYARRGRASRYAAIDNNNNGPTNLDSGNFGRDPRQFIDARRANEIDGPFLRTVAFGPNGEVDTQLLDRGDMARRANYIMDKLVNNRIALLGAFCFIFSRISRQACHALLDNGLRLPMNFGLMWPFIRINTYAILFAQGGAETCQLRYGFTRATNPSDGMHMMQHINLVTTMGCAVINPANIVIIPDAALAGYESGLSSKFMKHPRETKIQASRGFDIANIKHDGCYVVDLPVTCTRSSVMREGHNPMTIFGRHDPEVYVGVYADRDNIFNPKEPHFPSWNAYNVNFGWTNVNQNARYDARSYRHLKESNFVPGTMFLCRTQTWNSAENRFTYDNGTRGTGPLDFVDPEKTDFKAMMDGTVDFKDSYGSFHA
jgi:hypothetical protein